MNGQDADVVVLKLDLGAGSLGHHIFIHLFPPVWADSSGPTRRRRDFRAKCA